MSQRGLFACVYRTEVLILVKQEGSENATENFENSKLRFSDFYQFFAVFSQFWDADGIENEKSKTYVLFRIESPFRKYIFFIEIEITHGADTKTFQK